MLKFFRRIRKRLLDSGKIRKYWLYAFGEVLLIVIGVLIALYLTNWNDKRKENAFVEKTLIEIQSELNDLSPRFKYWSKRLEKRTARVSRLDSLLKEEMPPYTPALDTLFGAVWGIEYGYFERAAYDELKAAGLELIDDDALRKELKVLFEGIFMGAKAVEQMEYDLNFNFITPFYMANFHSFQFRVVSKPIDYPALWEGKEYQNVVHYRLLTFGNAAGNYKATLASIAKLQEMIDAYLGSR